MEALKRVKDRLKAEGIETKDILLAVSISPLLAILIFDFNSFTLGWNEGRGGLLFAILFLLIEWFDGRSKLKLNLNKKKVLGLICAIAALSTYFIAIYNFNLQDILFNYGKGFAVEGGLPSWVWLWDYVVFAASLIGSFIFLFNWRALNKIVTPIVYCLGSAFILLLDTFFPYQSIGFLAGLVPFIVKAVVSLLLVSGVTLIDNPFSAFNPPWVYVEENYLLLNGLNGLVVLEVNWPCVGVLSMLIYSLVILILMVKLDAPLKRKAIYAALGAIGTFSVNILRIFLITLAIAYSNVNVKIFHETIGEILFVIWIVIYLIVILKVESYISRHIVSTRTILRTRIFDIVRNRLIENCYRS